MIAIMRIEKRENRMPPLISLIFQDLTLGLTAGLWVGEVVKLKPEDIDSKRMLVFIKGAKGCKNRSCCFQNLL
ncbi:MAG: hypothetical protein AB1638_05990 [Nitrospirota bacterium]